MHREPRRWRTQFGSWVRAYTVPRPDPRTSGSLGQPVTPNAIYGWLAGRIAPHPERALAITRISSGRVSLQDIYQDREQLRPVGSVVRSGGQGAGR